ncbi:Histidine kinase [Chitinophaga sp. CF118]|uniref:sensor histidine kinase n=1 Tax=Chitinophaga sp. CF118 TaxID=1884367 RepID=UPI0008E21103|nr:histidine kinase [Chitinophaga sp. CF118]SFF03962.1 Histidine kinase [Chitinophaga sp. CF118]
MEITAVNEPATPPNSFNLNKLHNLTIRSYVLKHVIAWCIYIFYGYLANLIVNPNESLLDIIFANLLSIWSFYAGYYCLIVALIQKKPVTGIVLWLAGLIVLFVLRYIYAYFLLDLIGLKPYNSNKFQLIIRDSILLYIRFFLYAIGFYYARKSLLKERELRKTEEEKYYLQEEKLRLEKTNLMSEYAFLRSQINPHFLHNTLNFFYAKSLGYSKELSESILTLCEIMRYSIDGGEDDSGTALLNKEIEHLQNVMKINQLRFSNRLQVSLTVNGDTSGIRIIPLVMITLVENAFKHGELINKDHPVKIELLVDKESSTLKFSTFNKKKNGPKDLSHGIGMDNIRKRLNAAYGDRHTFRIKDEEEFYSVDLFIDLSIKKM